MSKIFVINEIGFQYNDEYHKRESGGTPLKSFRKKENADAECERLNKEHFKERPLMDYENEPYKVYFRVVETELTDDDEVVYEEQTKRIEAEEQKLKLLARKTFDDATAKLFDKHPSLKSFAFKAYTPYFNDGDVCRYGVHADEPDINDMTYEEYYEGEGNENEWAKEVTKLVYSFRSQHIKCMFDEGEITVRRNGMVTVSDCHHD